MSLKLLPHAKIVTWNFVNKSIQTQIVYNTAELNSTPYIQLPDRLYHCILHLLPTQHPLEVVSHTKHKHQAEAEKGDEAGAEAGSSEAGGEVGKVVMDPGCTCCAWAKAVCKFLMDGNKKWVACIQCNLSKGKCWWPGDGKDVRYSGLEDKLKHLIKAMGLITNNLASLFNVQENVVANSGWITNALETIIDKSYGYGLLATPSDLGLSELNANKLHEEVE
ncbi:hypothetical protein F5J12DRAFT_896409 [Pisolithus orientalis]|uniref:uncharacterized protein n=1 Tax=Pisolithus orientalis TaxID=936130 RepID=UPI002224C4C1|nr:uncharacterized protein F5J12DRAFT_896409 [Pisolithus orientalis]KAI5995780.1 hypothetical protein F5J12DRAFT_896409 [Pisolithus orientalis]